MTMQQGTEKPAKPLPRPTALSRPFWEGCRRGELLVQRCLDCKGYIFIPQDFCRFCFGERLEWVRSAGSGTVYSYTVIWRPQTPAFEVPLIAAVIEMDEGYQMMSNVINCTPEEIRVGMAVSVVFERASDEITLPKFQPKK